jgi:ADP-heptose:LPS heptosyltransferase
MNYIISAYSGLGNTIQLTIIIDEILKKDKEAKITFISDNKYGQLDYLAFVEGVETRFFSRLDFVGLWRFFKGNKQGFTLLPFLGSPTIIQLLSYFSPNKIVQMTTQTLTKNKILAFFFKIFLGKRLNIILYRDGKSELDLYLILINESYPSGHRKELNYPNLKIKENTNLLKKLKINKRYICIQAGAANGNLTPKTWKKENILEFTSLIEKSYSKFSVVLLGDKGDSVNFNINNPSLINLIGKTTLEELLVILNHAELVICNDSSLMHISTALRKRTLALYGPTDFLRTFPSSPKTHMIKLDLECISCMKVKNLSEKQALLKCPIDNACMRNLKAEMVLEKIESMNLLA